MDTALKRFDLMRGLLLDSVWLACVGAGLRVGEFPVLRPLDVRRTTVARGGGNAARRPPLVHGGRGQEALGLPDIHRAAEQGMAAALHAALRLQARAEGDAAPRNPRGAAARAALEVEERPCDAHGRGGVLDSINAAMNANGERVASKHRIKRDTVSAAIAASKKPKLVI